MKERIQGQSGLHGEALVNMGLEGEQWFGNWSSGCGMVLPRCASGGDTHCPTAGRLGC